MGRAKDVLPFVYNLSEGLEDMNEEMGDPDIDKALELIINGLDLICDVLDRNEGRIK